MYLFLATFVTMIAFASNSILTRMAIDGGHIDPAQFAVVRVVAGAVFLAAIVSIRGGRLPLLRKNRISGALSLAVYLVGFSLAYLTLDAGLGALILFGVVQITMFSYSFVQGVPPTTRQITGGMLAFAGLLVALWPGPGGTADPIGAALMVLGGLGWAAYTIVGRSAQDPLAATASNFMLCAPAFLLLLISTGLQFSPTGMVLGVVCGGITSGLGYTLWYWVLPQLDGSTAAIVQLSVPVIALIAGAVLLGEVIGLPVIVATLLVVGGIWWSVTGQSAQAGRK